MSKSITYAELKAKLDTMTPEQLAQPVVWSGDERGGYVKSIWEAEEDFVGDAGDHESWVPRSEIGKSVSAVDYADPEIGIPKGTVHLMVD